VTRQTIGTSNLIDFTFVNLEGNMMAATVISEHIKHEHGKHGRRTLRAGLYFYLPVYTTITINVPQGLLQ